MSQARHVGKIVSRRPCLVDSLPCDGVWFVTGGLGMIGSLVAAWMTDKNAGDVVLLSRSGRGSNVKRPESGPLMVPEPWSSAAACDISSSECTQALMSLFTRDKAARGLVHSGGILSDGMAMNQTLASVRKVIGPKSTSSLVLRNNFARQPMGTSVMFSSVASLLGSPGQTNYSASNAVLDSLAQYQQASGLQWVSIQWGAWAEGGMASEQTRIAVERMGLGMVTPAEGMNAFNSLMFGTVCERPVVSAVPFIWDTFMERFREVPHMFDRYIQYWSEDIQVEMGRDAPAALAPSRTKPKVRQPKRSAAARAASEVDFEPQIQDAVKSVLGKTVDREDPLMAAGLDSLGTVELKNALEAVCGAELPSTLVFDHPTVGALASYLNASMASQAGVLSEDDSSSDESVDVERVMVARGRAQRGSRSERPAFQSERCTQKPWVSEIDFRAADSGRRQVCAGQDRRPRGAAHGGGPGLARHRRAEERPRGRVWRRAAEHSGFRPPDRGRAGLVPERQHVVPGSLGGVSVLGTLWLARRARSV